MTDDELVTRGFTGDLAHWKLSKPLSSMDGIIRCLPLRFDDETGGLMAQTQRCEFP